MRALYLSAGLLGATGLLGLAVAGGAGAGTASTEADRGERATHLVATTTAYDTNSGKKAAATDVSTYKLALTDKQGHKVGRDLCTCIGVDGDNMVCTGVLQLPHGSLSYTGPFRLTGTKTKAAITGGTGRFEGATGSFGISYRADSDPAVYDYDLHLRSGGGGWDLPGPDPSN